MHYLRLLIFAVSLPVAAAEFGKVDTTWDKLRHPDNSEKWNLSSEGFLTYTNAIRSQAPARHAYGWFHANANYLLTPHYSLNALATIQKTSFSRTLTEEPFAFSLFPQISFSGTGRDAIGWDALPASGHKLEVQLGAIPMFRHGQGLYFNQFTSGGLVSRLETAYFSVECGFIGYGFDGGDDVQNLYIYAPKKLIGLGVLHEINGVAGNRIIPGIAGEYFFGNYLRLYLEGGISFVYKSTRSSIVYDKYSSSRPIPYTRTNFDSSPSFDAKNLSGLVGTDFTFKRFWSFIDRVLFSTQFRAYGRDHVAFYEYQRYAGFDYFTDVTTDQRYNNQPFNYYLLPGAVYGIYLLQEIDTSPWKFLKVTLRNEFTYMRSQNGYPSTGYSPRAYGNDVLSVAISTHVDDKVFAGLKVSNTVIGYLQYEPSPTATSLGARGPMLLEAHPGVLLDFFVRYKIGEVITPPSPPATQPPASSAPSSL